MNAPAEVASGRVGPNAIIQLVAALQARHGPGAAEALLHAAGLDHYRTSLPERMTDEREAAALHRAVMVHYPAEWSDLARRAGEGTAEYLLAHRIPRPVQRVLRWLPPGWAARLLLRAIARHAWTFAGSGSFTARLEREGVTIMIAHNPVATPGCPWHVAVFTTLFRALVSRRTRVEQPDCCARGDAACRFVLTWHRPRSGWWRPGDQLPVASG
ncbi:bacteriochlorophyll 4-vinyl reductase [Novosphingobium piscinae]|uniref:Bacteriochlorophyll 4-vinyl reductase n=1 Tax=Novosphingobium piscinae TaxID=1507448 RepID=A0A7X1FZ79_9SPHN|nr:bacteriochlorophyll 4-vinyl reductase [Novosphingobium piscinae]